MRWAALMGLVFGVGLGLLAGWVAWPVEYADVTPDLLATDARVEYALMVATAYEADGNLELALGRLARLGDSASVTLLNTFNAAEDDEIALSGLQKLATELELHATMPTPTK